MTPDGIEVEEKASAAGGGADDPPTKRRKVGEDEATESLNSLIDAKGGQEDRDEAEPQDGDANGDAETPKKAGSKRKRGKQKNTNEPKSPRSEETPIILAMAATSDHQYLVAVTGADKAIWVFKTNGTGQLEKLSER